MSGGLHDAPFRERVIRSHRSGHDDADPRTAGPGTDDRHRTVTVRAPAGQGNMGSQGFLYRTIMQVKGTLLEDHAARENHAV